VAIVAGLRRKNWLRPENMLIFVNVAVRPVKKALEQLNMELCGTNIALLCFSNEV